jgi:Domain of unknown function (DUF4389)
VARRHYPVRVRIDYNPRSSRGWALLTITLVKFVALLPHALALFFLGLALIVAFIVAQAVVVARGTYPRPLFDFVAGVLRWQARVYGFAFSLTDVYPPFTLKPAPHYPVDLEIVYPKRSNPWLASFTVAALIFWLAVVLPLGWGAYSSPPLQLLNWLTNVRIFVLLPHYLVLFFFFLAALVVLAVGQVLILIGGYLPFGLHAFMAGWLRWMVRTWAWLYGLVDAYPPFTTEDTELGG